MRSFYPSLLLLLLTTSTVAQPLSDEQAEQVLFVLQPEQRHVESLTALDELNRRKFAEKIGDGKALTTDQKEEVDTAATTASRIVRTELAWAIVKGDLIRITRDSFGEDEARVILKDDPAAISAALAAKISAVQKQYHDHLLGRIDGFGPRLEADIDANLRALRKSQLDGIRDPLSHLDGAWAITTIDFNEGRPKVAECGLLHQPVHMSYQPNEQIALSTRCKGDGQYNFTLTRTQDRLSYVLTINSKDGINVESFPVSYKGSQGWTGTARQLVGKGEAALMAAIVPIEGKTWYGWASLIRPADAGETPDQKKLPVLRVDFTRRK